MKQNLLLHSLFSLVRRNASPLIFALVLLACATFVRAQNVRFDGTIQSRAGVPAAGAFVAVLSQPANTSLTPGSPLLSLCNSLTDSVCNPLVNANPVQADGLGNFHFYAKISQLPVTLQFYGSTVRTYIMPDQSLGAAGGGGSGGGFYQTIQNNGGAGLPQENILNLVQGTNVTVSCSDDPVNSRTSCTISATGGGGGGGPTIEVNGVPAATQSVLNFTDSVLGNGVSWNSAPGGVINALLNPNTLVETLTDQVLTDTGSAANIYAGCPAVTTVAGSGMQIHFVAAHSNTGSSTFNFCGHGSFNIVKNAAVALIANDIQAGGDMYLQFQPSNTAWALVNPMSTASGAFNGQKVGQPTVGLTPTTATTENNVLVAQAFPGTDLCQKINNALKACTGGATGGCTIVVNSSVAGTADSCSAATSDIWSGVGNFNVDIDLTCGTNIILNGPINAPTAGFLIHGCPSGQNFRSSGFTVSATFPANFQLWGPGCNTTTQCPSGPDGPLPSGLYVIPLIMGNRTSSSNLNLYTGQCQPNCASSHSWNNNAFGGKLRDMFIGCNHVPNCVAFITGNEQEDSGVTNLRIWDTAATSGTSACGIWAHTLTTDPAATNSGPSHFNADRAYCDPVASAGIIGSNDYGFIMQDCNIQGGIGASGGNWGFFHSTIRGGTFQNMVTAIWTGCATQPEIDHVHLEHITTDGIGLGAGGGTSNAHVSNITNVFTTSKTVHIYPGSGETIAENISGNTEITDDINSCSVNAAAPGLAFYTTDAGGEGYWNGGLHSCANVNTDTHGKLTLSGGGSVTYNFSASNVTAPDCTATDNTAANAVKASATTTVLTLNGTAGDSVTYTCHGRN